MAGKPGDRAPGLARTDAVPDLVGEAEVAVEELGVLRRFSYGLPEAIGEEERITAQRRGFELLAGRCVLAEPQHRLVPAGIADRLAHAGTEERHHRVPPQVLEQMRHRDPVVDVREPGGDRGGVESFHVSTP